MPSNPFPPINYPPGTLNDPNAPWNQVDLIGDCFECNDSKNVDDMSKDERQSYDDNDDGTFLCDSCFFRQQRKEDLASP